MSALTYSGLTVSDAIAGFDLAIEAGHVAVVCGGAGKVRLLRVALGLVVPEGGSVTTLGVDPFSLDGPSLRRLRSRCALVPRSGALLSNTSLRGNLELQLRYHGLVDERECGQRVAQALELLSLEDVADQRPTALTPQQRRLGALARARAVQPELLLIQDPFEGLGDRASDRVVEALDQLTALGGATLLTTAVTRPESTYDGRLLRLAGSRVVLRSKVGSPA